MRNALFWISLLALLVRVPECLALNWLEFSEKPDHVINYIDIDTISPQGDRVSVWTRQVFPQGPGAMFHQKQYNEVPMRNVRQINRLAIVNCKDNTVAESRAVYYSGNYSILYTVAQANPTFKPILPDTPDKSIRNIACP